MMTNLKFHLIIQHLHSTMVLFKFISAKNNDVVLEEFTFHYGPIQIKRLATYQKQT